MDRTDVERLRTLEVLVNKQEKALELQAREYERRLDNLNHAYQQAQAERHQYVSDEKFTGYVEKMEIWQQHVDRELSERAGKNVVIIQIVTFLIAVAAIAVHFIY